VSRIQFYVDEDAMDGDLVRALRSRGLDVLTALDAGMIGRADEDHLRFATNQDRVLYSFNLADFFQIHGAWLAAGSPHAGMILAQQQRLSVGEQMRRITRLAGSRTAESMRNNVEFLNNWRTG